MKNGLEEFWEVPNLFPLRSRVQVQLIGDQTNRVRLVCAKVILLKANVEAVYFQLNLVER